MVSIGEGLLCLFPQGCALREITSSPKFPNYEIQGAQHKAYMKEIRLSGHPKAKVSRLRHPGTLREQPCFQSDKVQYTHLFGDPRVKTYVVLTTWSPMSSRPAANFMEKEENKNFLKDEGKCTCT